MSVVKREQPEAEYDSNNVQQKQDRLLVDRRSHYFEVYDDGLLESKKKKKVTAMKAKVKCFANDSLRTK